MLSWTLTTDTFYYQYYFNRNGKPLSSDFITYERTRRDNVLAWSYYYQWGCSNEFTVAMS